MHLHYLSLSLLGKQIQGYEKSNSKNHQTENWGRHDSTEMKLAIYTVKYVPIIATILLMVQCVLALFNINVNDYAYTIFGHSILYNSVLLALSYAFRFCSWHRVIIMNLIAINVFEWIDVNIYSFNALTYVLSIVLALMTSSLVAAYLYQRHGVFTKAASSKGNSNGG